MYNELGVQGLGDSPRETLRERRQFNQGAKTLINDLHQAQLWQALQEKSPDGGLWNGRKVADWLTQLTGTTISRQRGWEILRQMTFRLRVPRPAHVDSDPCEQEAWKKN
jgi:transposase